MRVVKAIGTGLYYLAGAIWYAIMFSPLVLLVIAGFMSVVLLALVFWPITLILLFCCWPGKQQNTGT